MPFPQLRLLAAVGLAIVSLQATTTRSRVNAEESPSFQREIRPLLSDRCFSCHGFDAGERQGGLRLDDAASAQKGGDSGQPAIVPGELEPSSLWQRITSDAPDQKMPPPESHKQLAPEEVELLGRWILAGAQYEGHWAFQRVQRPSAGPQRSIDYWIDRALSERQLTISGPADPRLLLRRLTIDLTGLPPTEEELLAFVADSSDQGYSRQVERLLASPRFGERWASLWLDVARYGDTNGYLHDLKRNAWPWRDWVIDAFNRDLPYDQFVREQLAGDLLPEASDQQVLATSFNRNHLLTTEGGSIPDEFLNEYASDRVQTFGTAFLGLSFQCARCHDHKFDPISQEDFYSLQSYFNSIGERHDNSAAYAPTLLVRSPLAPSLDPLPVMVMKEAEPKPNFVLRRGQYDLPMKDRPVSRRVPESLGMGKEAVPDRLALANWLTNPAHPLFSRVMVNRVWHRLFGRGLVETLDDFGLQGEYPSHPELLDELAGGWMEGHSDWASMPWSLKGLIRRIVSSRVYRQSAVIERDAAERDPENRWLSRFPRQRLSAEELRDQSLAVAGLLVERLGGAPVYPYQPEGLWEERANEGSDNRVYVRSEGESLFRRSIYTFWKRTCPPAWLAVFDAPDRTQCVARRALTSTPLQALALWNDEQILEAAKGLACDRLKSAPPLPSLDRDTQILQSMAVRCTSLTLGNEDQERLLDLLAHFRRRFAQAPQDAKELIQIGTLHWPAVDEKELASWMMVASTLLGSDRATIRP
jgi:hypothetical protein